MMLKEIDTASTAKRTVITGLSLKGATSCLVPIFPGTYLDLKGVHVSTFGENYSVYFVREG